MPDQILSPKRIATEAFTDAAEAVARIAEIYERNVGSKSKLGIPRGLNQLWSAGGIQYAPPIR